jgi:hypothetical protein
MGSELTYCLSSRLSTAAVAIVTNIPRGLAESNRARELTDQNPVVVRSKPKRDHEQITAYVLCPESSDSSARTLRVRCSAGFLMSMDMRLRFRTLRNKETPWLTGNIVNAAMVENLK